MRLQIEALWDDCFNDNDLRYALDNFPKDLDSTYRRCLERVERNGDTNHVLQVFQWVACASRSLHIAEMQEAIAFTTADRRWVSGKIQSSKSIVGRCANLVVVDALDHHIRFAHPSVLQYIIKRAVPDHAFRIDYKQGKLSCAEFSINYLSFSDFGSRLQEVDRTYDGVAKTVLASTNSLGKMMSKIARHRPRRTASSISVGLPPATFLGPTPGDTRFKFLSYAAENWANDSKFITKESRMWENFRSLAIEPSTSWKLHPWHSDGLSQHSHLHGLLAWAVRKRHLPLLEILVQSTAEFKVAELCREPLVEDGLPALHLASRLGYDDVVTLLLNVTGANTLDYLRRTALHHAAEKGHSGVTKILLATKSVKLNEMSNLNATPLLLAARQGHLGVARLLLDAGAKVKMSDRTERTALSWAAENGHAAVVRLFVERDDVNPNASDSEGRTPVFAAAEAGCDNALRMLLARDSVDINRLAKSGESPLDAAIRNQHETAVTLLLRRSDLVINYGSSRKFIEKPLYQALQKNNEKILELLLARNDLNVNIRDSRGRTPLMQAINNDLERIVEMILE